MGHVYTNTTLQDTGLLCSNDTVVPSCRALARTLDDPVNQRMPCTETETAAGKQVQTDPHAKKAQKSKATATPLAGRHRDEGLGTPPSQPLRQPGGEEEKRGRKPSPGSWHSTWPTASFSAPASQALPCWWAPRAGGCSVATPRPPLCPPARTCRAGGSHGHTAHTPLKKLKGELGLFAELRSGTPAAPVVLQNSRLKHRLFVQEPVLLQEQHI